MAVRLIWNTLEQFLDGNGNPYSGAKLFTYTAGSSTKQASYQDSAGSVAHTNPIVLNADGRIPAALWGTTSQTYKLILAPSGDTDPPASPIFTVDNVAPINDVAAPSLDQWVSGPAPTFVSASQFTLAGDQTSNFHVGRRVKVTDSGGVKYATISASAFGALTTVTVTVDAGGSLVSPLSAVSYGLLSYSNPSIPNAHLPTGVTMGYFGATAPAGWVLLSGRTIGSSSSGGTERANADTEALFKLLWDSLADAEAPVSTGRGASAAADFAANKTITLPDERGRSEFGKDDMGGTAAGRVTTAGSSIDGTVLGRSGGAQNVTIGTSNLPASGLSVPGLSVPSLSVPSLSVSGSSITLPSTDGSGSNDGVFRVNILQANNGGAMSAALAGSFSGSTGTGSTGTGTTGTGTTGNMGTGGALNKMPGAIIKNKIIKL